MKSAWVVRHLAFEGLGVFAEVLEQRGYRVRMFEAPVTDLAELDAGEPDLLVLLGGPIGAFDEAVYPYLAGVLQWVEQRLASGRKLLGVCLGAQLIARAMGGQVRPMGVKEIGYAPLTLTAAGRTSVLAPLHASIPVLHWHGDQFEIPRAPRTSRPPPPARIRLSPLATPCWRCSSIWKQTLGRSRPGW
ncbi:glutamine amidotransferase-related protein [Pseudomonas eucalypticola]|uniref:glutamine amidotransferase-related protein n=1 Tax=Pseudomonas eucalypticola TaxID=2599595 RepID=UPI001FD747EA|nr:hypothetical protein [Pseudomonas eucalypticola]